MVTVQDEMRKGPWTEQEDLQLVCTVRLFGDRRWDFVAKSLRFEGWETFKLGLNRTGKSCRLRWVNYLHPGLKHGRMSPQEEHLIIELHARWGNRWSRIARRLPGRTDNEIKNYWRTHMRKKAQERTTDMSPSSSSSSFTYQSCLLGTAPIIRMDGGRTHDGSTCISSGLKSNQNVMDGYSMDQIWKEIEAPTMLPTNDKVCNNLPYPLLPSPPMGDRYCPEVVWKMDDDDIKMLAPQFGYGNGGGSCY